jgi:hypothetical protein
MQRERKRRARVGVIPRCRMRWGDLGTRPPPWSIRRPPCGRWPSWRPAYADSVAVRRHDGGGIGAGRMVGGAGLSRHDSRHRRAGRDPATPHPRRHPGADHAHAWRQALSVPAVLGGLHIGTEPSPAGRCCRGWTRREDDDWLLEGLTAQRSAHVDRPESLHTRRRDWQPAAMPPTSTTRRHDPLWRHVPCTQDSSATARLSSVRARKATGGGARRTVDTRLKSGTE